MRILLDNCVPRQLRAHLLDHQVDVARYRGWDRLANGALLAVAELEYDLLITADQNLRYQQNVTGRRIAIIILPTNRRRDVLALVTKIQDAIRTIKPGG